MLWSFVQFCATTFTFAHILRKILERTLYKGVDITKEEDVRNKIIIVTGSNTGIGLQSAYEFAARDANVILACRDKQKAEEAIKWIRSKTNLGNLSFHKLDLASLESVRDFAKEFTEKYDHLDFLINNAGVALPKYKSQRTADGFELQMGVNHLGHFLLTNLLLEPLKKEAPSRIVHVSSSVHILANMDLDDLMSDTKDTNYPVPLIPFTDFYCRSKTAQILFNKELAKRLRGTGVTTYCLCPGAINTNIGKNASWVEMFITNVVLGYFLKTPEEGASTTMYCALNKDLANQSGQMYQDYGRWHPTKRTAYTDEEAKKLWEISAKFVNL